MKPEFKNFSFKLDGAAAQEGIIEGLASTFGNIDLGEDVVDHGAFKKTIQESKGLIPILADHNPADQIGWNLEAKETKDGLYVRGQLELKTIKGAERFALAQKAMELGAKMGLSIGYSAIKVEYDAKAPGVRRLKEVKLWEYSLVTFPMNQSSMVTAAKTWAPPTNNEIKTLVSSFTEYAKTLGYSPSEISNALRQFGAATKTSFDPSKVGQSIDSLIKSINASSKGNP